MPSKEELLQQRLDAYNKHIASSESLQKRLDAYNASLEQKAPVDNESTFDKLASATRATGESLLSNLTFGASRPVTAGINALLNKASGYLEPTNIELRKQGFDVQEPSLSQEYQNEVRAQQIAEERNPIASLGGGVTGALLGGKVAAVPFVAGEKVAAELGNVATKVVPALEGKGIVSAIAKPIGNVAKSAIVGGIGSGLTQGAQNVILENTGFDAPVSAAEAALSGAAFAGKLSTGIESVKLGGKALAKTALMFSRLRPEDVDYYVKNTDDVNKVDINEVKKTVDDVHRKLVQDIENGKIGVEDAKNVLKGVAEEAKARTKELTSGLRTAESENVKAHIDAVTSNASIERMTSEMKAAQKAAEENLKRVGVPLSYPEQIENAVSDLKTKLVSSSKKSYSYLEGKQFPIFEDAKAFLEGLKKKYYIEGTTLPSGADSEQAIKAIDSKIEHLDSLAGHYGKDWFSAATGTSTPKTIKGSSLKGIIQGLDRETNWSRAESQFDDPRTQVLKQFRGFLDETLKSHSPEYAKFMASEVAPLASARDYFDKLFIKANSIDGTKGKILSVVNDLHDPQWSKLQEVKKLGEMTGNDLITPIKDYLNARTILADKAKVYGLKDSLPEVAALKTAEAKHSALLSTLEQQKQAKVEEFQKQLVQQQQKQSLDFEKAQKFLAEKKGQLTAAEEKLKPISDWTEKGSQAKLEKLGRTNQSDRGIFLQKQLDYLNSLQTERKLKKDVQDLYIKGQKEKSVIQGSRGVNFGKYIGAGIGTVLGSGVGGSVGGVVGAGLGILLESKGPEYTMRAAKIINDAKGGDVFKALDKQLGKDSTAAKNAIMKAYLQMNQQKKQKEIQDYKNKYRIKKDYSNSEPDSSYVSPDEAAARFAGHTA